MSFFRQTAAVIYLNEDVKMEKHICLCLVLVDKHKSVNSWKRSEKQKQIKLLFFISPLIFIQLIIMISLIKIGPKKDDLNPLCEFWFGLSATRGRWWPQSASSSSTWTLRNARLHVASRQFEDFSKVQTVDMKRTPDLPLPPLLCAHYCRR